MKRRVFFSLLFSFAAVLWLAKLPVSTAQQIHVPALPDVAGTIIRMLVYHEVTALSRGVVRDYPLISGNGNQLVYAMNGSPSPVYVTNFDGTGTRTVDTFQDPPKVDISYDGATVLVVQGGGHEFRQFRSCIQIEWSTSDRLG